MANTFIRMSESEGDTVVDKNDIQLSVEDSAEVDKKEENMSSSQRTVSNPSSPGRNESGTCLLDDDELTEQQIKDRQEEEARRRQSQPDEDETTNQRAAQRNSSANRRRVQEEEVDEDEEMMYGAQHVIKLFVPVSLCMLVVVLTVASVNYYTDQSGGVYLIYTPFHPEVGDSTAKTIGDTLLNALIILVVIVVMTTVLVLLYKYKFYKVIYGWLIGSSLIMLFAFSFIYLEAVMMAYNIAFDYLSLAIFIWNFGCMGLLAMHWKAPLRVLQGYHIVISALLALVFIKYLPEWTLWMVLVVIALWDLVAVLCPHGPLRMLVNIAHERNENIFPSLIYTSTVAYTIGMADSNPSGNGTLTEDTTTDSEEGTRRPANNSVQTRSASHPSGQPETDANASASAEAGADRPLRDSSAWRESYGSSEGALRRRRSNEEAETNREGGDEEAPPTNRRERRPDGAGGEDEEEEDKGVKLGLGDFIFYSILVGKSASSGDWATTIAAYIAILMGLFFTLLILAIKKQALPALPISIFFGLIFNFGTQYVISPFVSQLAANQIFI